jgi:hypothetical protein
LLKQSYTTGRRLAHARTPSFKAADRRLLSKLSPARQNTPVLPTLKFVLLSCPSAEDSSVGRKAFVEADRRPINAKILTGVKYWR